MAYSVGSLLYDEMVVGERCTIPATIVSAMELMVGELELDSVDLWIREILEPVVSKLEMG